MTLQSDFNHNVEVIQEQEGDIKDLSGNIEQLKGIIMEK